jgi:hypothetical protein
MTMFLLFACIIGAAYIFGEDNGTHPQQKNVSLF